MKNKHIPNNFKKSYATNEPDTQNPARQILVDILQMMCNGEITADDLRQAMHSENHDGTFMEHLERIRKKRIKENIIRNIPPKPE